MRFEGLDDAFSVELKGKRFEGDLASDLKIDKVNLSDEFTKQASVYAWWATLSALAQEKYQHKRLERKIVEAELDKEKRLTLGAENNRRVTEKVVEREVHLDPRWRKAYEEEIEAAKEAAILSGATEALRQRKDMLVALGLQLREELRSDQVLREATK